MHRPERATVFFFVKTGLQIESSPKNHKYQRNPNTYFLVLSYKEVAICNAHLPKTGDDLKQNTVGLFLETISYLDNCKYLSLSRLYKVRTRRDFRYSRRYREVKKQPANTWLSIERL